MHSGPLMVTRIYMLHAKPWQQLLICAVFVAVGAALMASAEAEAQDPNSVFHYFQWLIAFRKRTPALVYGDYKDLDPQHPTVFAYTRDKYLVILNFSKKSIRYELPPGAKAGHLILSNQVGPREEQTSTLNLKPWEARIYQ